MLARARELGYEHRDIAALHEVLSRTTAGTAFDPTDGRVSGRGG
jgi:hypothetical protein